MRDYYLSPKSKNYTLLKIILLGLFLLCLVFVAVGFYAYSKLNKPMTYYSSEKVFEIAKGESASAAGSRLQRESLISSAFVFRIYFSFHPGLRIQAGKFLLNSNMTLKQIAARLSAGRGIGDEVRVTFLEGDTIGEQALRFEQAGLGTAAGFVRAAKNFPQESGYQFLADKPKSASLEGYLFPDTYNFSRTTTPDEAIVKLLDNFERKLTRELRAEIARQKKTVYEIVILASLVEGEVGRNYKTGTALTAADIDRLSQERRLVAGVFYNRLAVNHALESDATINYITGHKTPSVSIQETKLDNPYNTYRFRGLPPGPINSPSLDSILAAIYPAQTDYFYFLSKPDGEAFFAKTFEEHNANKAKYLR